jgi:hypothetical protein
MIKFLNKILPPLEVLSLSELMNCSEGNRFILKTKERSTFYEPSNVEFPSGEYGALWIEVLCYNEIGRRIKYTKDIGSYSVLFDGSNNMTNNMKKIGDLKEETETEKENILKQLKTKFPYSIYITQ